MREEGIEYRNDSPKESVQDKYKFYIVHVRGKCIFLLPSFKFMIVS